MTKREAKRRMLLVLADTLENDRALDAGYLREELSGADEERMVAASRELEDEFRRRAGE